MTTFGLVNNFTKFPRPIALYRFQWQFASIPTAPEREPGGCNDHQLDDLSVVVLRHRGARMGRCHQDLAFVMESPKIPRVLSPEEVVRFLQPASSTRRRSAFLWCGGQ